MTGSPLPLFEKRMWRERNWKSLLVAQDLRRSVGIFLAADVASYDEWIYERRKRLGGIGLSENNLVCAKEVPFLMEPSILTEHYPAIRFVLPHPDALSLGMEFLDPSSPRQ
jgi:hypothetical protein